MSRQLASEGGNDASLRLGRSSVIAFAVWDGSNEDRDGQKAVSVWLAMTFPAAEPTLLDAWPFLLLMVLVFGVIAVIMVVGGREPAAGVGWPGGRPPGEADPSGSA
jgi:complex iron-sulfur molybdoenzyme family reductase subunit gamma